MASMNVGKACAQAHHAGTHFLNTRVNTEMYDRVAAWKGDRGFGTVVTLGVDEADIDVALYEAAQRNLLYAQIIDPTYPIRDGKVTHYLRVLTCAYIFGSYEETEFLRKHKLHH